MSEFKHIKIAISAKFKELEQYTLLTTSIRKDALWETYLAAFPPGTNEIYRERAEHDCQCCKQFIRAGGNVVAIVDGELVSIWDVDVPEPYKSVAAAMSNLVKGSPINGTYYHYEKQLGTDISHMDSDNGIIAWGHFHHVLNPIFVKNKDSIPTTIGRQRTSKETLKRALEELSIESAETVLELISQNSLYRGDQYKDTVQKFITAKKDYLLSKNQELFIWGEKISANIAGIRNSSIGQLLIDLTANVDLNTAVSKYEAMVAPSNYKRPTALITKGMIKKAEDKVNELGLQDALQRRYAHIDDITINNVIFANRDAKKAMNAFDDLAANVPVKMDSFKKVEEITIDNFIKDVLPTAGSIEMMFENKHINNLVSLIAPVTASAPNMLKWDNNFSWSYNGEVTDSMKERVKAAGGKVDGILRFSLQWNDNLDDQSIDFDAHCHEPNNNHIYYPKAGDVQRSSGILDVDNTSPGNRIAVENITWSNRTKMEMGAYKFNVHNYSSRASKSGFSAELEFDGDIHTFVYDKPLRGGETINVAIVDINAGKTTMKIISSLDSTSTSKGAWNINTNNFHKVSVVMQSPNFWDEQAKGNKHWFFMLTNCANPEASRGFYNEFLNDELTEHRKVFEVLGSKMKTPESNDQLSGLGFSSTKRDSVLCKVTGNFNRVLKINF